jgi:type IV secretory pathway TraG/TraD family ATPase VirD4
MITASGGFVAIIGAIAISVWRAREAKNIVTYGSARWATEIEIRASRLLSPEVGAKPDACRATSSWSIRTSLSIFQSLRVS